MVLCYDVEMKNTTNKDGVNMANVLRGVPTYSMELSTAQHNR